MLLPFPSVILLLSPDFGVAWADWKAVDGLDCLAGVLRGECVTGVFRGVWEVEWILLGCLEDFELDLIDWILRSSFLSMSASSLRRSLSFSRKSMWS